MYLKNQQMDKTDLYQINEINILESTVKMKYVGSKTLSSESEECVIFQQLDLFSQGFPVMEEIRRQGKLCDVTLKVRCSTFSFTQYWIDLPPLLVLEVSSLGEFYNDHNIYFEIYNVYR